MDLRFSPVSGGNLLMDAVNAGRIKGARSEHRIKQGRNTVYVRRRAIAISEVAIEFTID